MLRTGELQARSAKLGSTSCREIREAELGTVAEVRGRGLWIVIEREEIDWALERIIPVVESASEV